jgi:hypothetical protein
VVRDTTIQRYRYYRQASGHISEPGVTSHTVDAPMVCQAARRDQSSPRDPPVGAMSTAAWGAAIRRPPQGLLARAAPGTPPELRSASSSG